MANPTPARPAVPRQPRLFALQRLKDVHGASGTGMVAWGIVFPDGRVAMRWDALNGRVGFATLVIADSIQQVEAVHGHGGNTRVVWLTLPPTAHLLQTGEARALVGEYRAAWLNRDKSMRHLELAQVLAGRFPAVLDAVEAMAAELGELRAAHQQLQAEAAAMQDALDTIADVDQAVPGGR